MTKRPGPGASPGVLGDAADAVRERRRRPRREWPARVIPALLAALLILASLVMGYQGFEALRDTRRRRAALLEEVARLERQASALDESIRKMRDDPVTLRLHARREHQLAAPGEIVILLEPPADRKPPE